MIIRIACILIGYLLGSFSPAYFYGLSKGINIKNEGSKNAGTTNALRVLGKKAGIIVFLGDVFKAIIASLICLAILGGFSDVGTYQLVTAYTSLGVFLGHSFPFYLRFSGGKGIACMLGSMLMVDWKIALICFGIFIIIVAITKYVSLGSIISAFLFFVGFLVFTTTGLYGKIDNLIEINIVIGLLIALIIFRHKANIIRLFNGTENKLSLKRS